MFLFLTLNRKKVKVNIDFLIIIISLVFQNIVYPIFKEKYD